MEHLQRDASSQADGGPLRKDPADRHGSAHYRRNPGCRAFEQDRVNVLYGGDVQQVRSDRAACQVMNRLCRPGMVRMRMGQDDEVDIGGIPAGRADIFVNQLPAPLNPVSITVMPSPNTR